MSAEELLQRILEAHGGMDARNAVDAIKISVRCGGMALAIRISVQ